MSDILDNRTPERSLAQRIRTILQSSEMARFAVGYFFLSGFEAIADSLGNLNELRLLIGNTSSQQTIEQLAEGYRRLELVRGVLEGQVYRKRSEAKAWAEGTAINIRVGMEVMDQTDEGESLVASLAQMIEAGKLKVRIYTKGRLHAKAYIFDYGTVYDTSGRVVPRTEAGIAVVGSSNLSLAGISHNTELNVLVHGNDNHTDMVQWFDALWNEAEDFDQILMDELQQSWAAAPVRPYDIYMKTLYALVKDRVEGDPDNDVLWDDEITNKLASFQKVAVRQAVQMIRDHRGAFVADVVGLGKSFIGAAIVKHFERTEHARALIVCPAPLVDMWEQYNERYQLNARVLSMGMLRENGGGKQLLELYRDRDFVLIDESHNLRHSDTQRYRVIESFMVTGRRCCLLTATPRNKSAWDVYAQMKLFHPDDRTDLPVDPPHLRDYFNLVEAKQRSLPALLAHILVRRTRTHILRWYGFDSETNEPVDPANFEAYRSGGRRAYVMVSGRQQFFPRRELVTVEYSIEQTYRGLYQDLRACLGEGGQSLEEAKRSGALTFARYGLWHYVNPAKRQQKPYLEIQRAGANLRGLIRIMLFKRLESSVYAFRETVRRLTTVHQAFLTALERGIVAAGEEAQTLLYESDSWDESDLLEALEAVSQSYRAEDFDLERLKADITHDLGVLGHIAELVSPITSESDAKLQTLKQKLAEAPLTAGKRLIFTQYADTAYYLHQQLNPQGKLNDVEVIYSREKSKARIVGRFAPRANPETSTAGVPEINTLIATDVLAEGLNLQDCNMLINYDLHWNPVRLIQRFGRIDRIGTEHDVVYGFNFLPELGIEENLGLREKLHNRIQEIHDTIGEDAVILDQTEQLNPEALYAIYEQGGRDMGAFEIEDEESFLDLNEAEEMLRQLRTENPAEYSRIASLRDGIRSTWKNAGTLGLYVFCQAGRYQQLFLLDQNGEITSRDVPRILGTIRCGPDEPGSPVPPGHNQRVMAVKARFAEEVRLRQAKQDFSPALAQSQRYALRELRLLYNATQTVEDSDLQSQITLIERAFRAPLTQAVVRELNTVRRNGVKDRALLRQLIEIYHHHNMRDWADRQQSQADVDAIPRILCSEALG